MNQHLHKNLELPPNPLNRWLRFHPSIEADWEADLGGTRVGDLRQAILVGLLLYNAFNVSDATLIADTAWMTVLVRIVVATPVTVVLFHVIDKVSATVREQLILIALLNAALLPVPAFVASNSVWAPYAFPEFFLSVVYGNMLLALRFRHACILTAVCFVAGFGSLFARGEEPALIGALTFQLAVVCVFSLVANYQWERRRCEAYLVSLQARLKGQREEQARRLYQELYNTDALTGLPNRRFLDQSLAEWANAGSAVALVMIDVDYFKTYNDVLGHPAGDDCLRRIATALSADARTGNGFAARFGGEEFTVAFPTSEKCRTEDLVRNLLASVEELAVLHPGRADGTPIVTISAGVATRDAGSAWDADELIAQADKALYGAKHSGRNRFAVVA